ncbi:hypothetical protein K450DRAFT_250637 [Umbelopsis ramanniana AG]|uniref:Uncharacterized protein n=1 Tax=Umbelopsis ramanniana AG TaxID=1314678 RepID=A0AAD5E8U7_UMBRA|nr:uncharacterized protein K450DRAFT_250637 [Umbelopsis ramanniana AG]KAI8577750.1 hypothetical protein K450DRAFT_250637 [Umbelopsis ramanniana AG]
MACLHIVIDRMPRGSLFSICNTHRFVIKQNTFKSSFFVHFLQHCYHLFYFFLYFFFYLQCVPFSSVRWSPFARDVYVRGSHPQQLD